MKKQFSTNKTGIFLLAVLAVSFSAKALMLDKEIARMPAAERPSPERVAAENETQKQWADYQDQLWQKLQPQLEEWAKQGKPYLPRSIFPNDLPPATVPAFPGAEGGGKFSFGGRGGKVFIVTNLDGGRGSFCRRI